MKTDYGTWKRIGVKETASDLTEMRECCRNTATAAILRTSGEADGFACIGCSNVWEKVSPVDESLSHKIDVLKGKA